MSADSTSPRGDRDVNRPRVLSDEDQQLGASLSRQVADLRSYGRYADAIPPAEALFDLCLRNLGENHWETVDARLLVETLRQVADFPDEDRHALQTVDDISSKGDRDTLSDIYKQIEVRSRLLGGDHSETLMWIGRLAIHHRGQGEISESELLYRRAIEGMRRTLGDDHPTTLLNLSHLAMILHAQGDLTVSEELFRRVADTSRRILGEDHPDTRGAMHNLAGILFYQGHHAESEAMFRKLLLWFRERCGERHPATLKTLGNLAEVLQAQGAYEEAERLLRKRLAINQSESESEDTDIEALHALARVLHAKGDWRESDRLYRRALKAHHRLIGIEDAKLVQVMNDLGDLLYEQGKYDEAEDLFESTARIFESVRERMSFAGFARARFASESSPRPALAVCLAQLNQPVRAWACLEASRGRGLLDTIDRATESSAHPSTREARKQIALLHNRMSSIDERISVLSNRVSAESQDSSYAELVRKRDALQAELIAHEKVVSDQSGPASGIIFSQPEIQKALKPNTAILTWVDYKRRSRTGNSYGDHWACVLRHTGDPIWVRLRGNSRAGEWTDEDEKRVDRVASLLARRGASGNPPHPEIVALYRQRIQPVEAHLGGIDQLIVIPTGRMGGVPVEVLTDRYTVSYALSGTAFAWLASGVRPMVADPSGVGVRPSAGKTLLAVGDAVYDGSDSLGTRLSPLPGSRREVQAIASLFDGRKPAPYGRTTPPPLNTSDGAHLKLLLGADANERTLQQLNADGSLSRYRYIHIAAHGALDPQSPWRSALILSRSSSDAAQRVMRGLPAYDGRLTAEQIMQTWKLDADLVTLSGCETALGRSEGGEGYLGFSQALFVSGARSLLLSLWAVDDRATTLLMRRFYENLLGRFDDPRVVMDRTFAPGRPIPKAVALHEAKQWLRGRSPLSNRSLLARMGFDEVEERLAVARGGILIADEQPRMPYDYSDPYYWAGFILVGDPE
ncbi:MAG: CHAT domain-containing protein [Phycisphaerae bacterium]